MRRQKAACHAIAAHRALARDVQAVHRLRQAVELRRPCEAGEAPRGVRLATLHAGRVPQLMWQDYAWWKGLDVCSFDQYREMALGALVHIYLREDAPASWPAPADIGE